MRFPIRLKASSKYRAIRTDGYASKKEAARAAELRLLERLGEIRGLQEQVAFELVPRQAMERAVTYRADFVYEKREEGGNWSRIVEDAKGVKTEVYKLKRKLMLWRHGVAIQEV